MQPKFLFYFHSTLAELFRRVAWKVLLSNSKYEINKTCNFNLWGYRKCEDICTYMYCVPLLPLLPLLPHSERGKLSEPRTKRTALQSSWIMCVHRRISFSLHPCPPPALHLPFMHCHALLRPQHFRPHCVQHNNKVFAARFCCRFIFLCTLCNKMPRQEACQNLAWSIINSYRYR